jgi:hypothetical protein
VGKIVRAPKGRFALVFAGYGLRVATLQTVLPNPTSLVPFYLHRERLEAKVVAGIEQDWTV